MHMLIPYKSGLVKSNPIQYNIHDITTHIRILFGYEYGKAISVLLSFRSSPLTSFLSPFFHFILIFVCYFTDFALLHCTGVGLFEREEFVLRVFFFLILNFSFF